MRRKRTFYGSAPVGDQWIDSCETFYTDHASWRIYYCLSHAQNGFMNFKIFAETPVKSKANYWIGMNARRTFNTDGLTLMLRPDLNEWARSVMDRIYSQKIGPREIVEVVA